MEWLLSVGFVESLNDPCIFFHPKTKLRIGVHVDDIIVRGQRQASKEFWQSVDRKFGVKSLKKDSHKLFSPCVLSAQKRMVSDGTVLTNRRI